MKTIKSVLFLFPALLLSTSVLAAPPQSQSGFTGQVVQQGFNGPFQGINSVEMALNASDDAHVVMTGHISASIGEEWYQFVDQTGSITVEIDHDKWMGLSISPETRITIYGEVDKEFAQTATIDVKRVQLAN
ncbi:NirD/YgiW/YdeI family stress tolerance protein [Endozoicomonas sp. SESOKO1]|uniref:NirD/YgiW/YdeI family stress tolerance protein n=1 Tax=Endozoicomonas sp. SESOKO1 TaxID=2828742 RepID=UPI0021483899|nr:NirD/YgiW/YdeI family stress tolerance protein [Endozoicomonas sp. SESOKO1]